VDWLGIGVAVLNLIAVPAIFGGNNFMEALVTGMTTTAGVYAYISVVKGVAEVSWLIIVDLSMMRMKREVVAPTPAYGG
jgi:hypothetical protein